MAGIFKSENKFDECILVNEQGSHRLELVSLDKIVKDQSVTLNVKNNKKMNKLKLVSMGILCLGFVCLNANEISLDNPIAVIEPGVTQAQLADFLAEHCPKLTFNVCMFMRNKVYCFTHLRSHRDL